jgi:hypothetical protein
MCLKIETVKTQVSGLGRRVNGVGVRVGDHRSFINLKDYYSFLFLLPKALPVNCVPVPCLFLTFAKLEMSSLEG